MPTETTTYNGWTNYATWGVALVLDNDEGTYNYVHDHLAILTQDVDEHPNVTSGIWTRGAALRFDMADWLKELVDELCGLDNVHGVFEVPEPSLMARQLLGAATSDVDWDEIADHYVSALDD